MSWQDTSGLAREKSVTDDNQARRLLYVNPKDTAFR